MSDYYRIEFFTDQMVFASSALISKAQRIDLDFLTFGSFAVETPLIPCKKGWFAHIVDGTELLADGVVNDVEPQTGKQLVAVKPLQALFDVEVFATPITDVIAWLSAQITANFINSGDAAQNRPVAVTSSGSVGGIESDKAVINLLDIMSEALTTYGVVVDCRLDFSSARIAVNIYQQAATATIESDLPNVLERSVTLGDSFGAANKLIVQELGTENAVIGTTEFYLHPDGTVDTNSADRITPVFWKLKQQKTSDDFAEAALNLAKQTLTPKAFDNEVTLKYRRGDMIAQPMHMAIGTEAVIYINGTAYRSILTGKQIEAGAVTLTFGKVRAALTKKLILERRNGA